MPGAGRRRRPRSRRSSCRRGRGWRGRRRPTVSPQWPDDSVRPSASAPPPSATRSVSSVRRSAHARDSRPGSPARATAGRAPRPTPRTSIACSRSRRRGRRPEAARAPSRYGAVVVATGGPARHRRRTRARPGPRAIAASYSGPASLAIVVLDPQQHPAPGRRGEAPDPDRVGDVAEMQVAGRRRREPRPAHRSDRDRRRQSTSSASRVGPVASRDRAPRAPGSPRSAGGRARAGRPGAAARRWPSSPGAAPRARARRRGSPAGPARPWPGPASRASSARSLSSATIRRSSASIRRRSRRSSGVSGVALSHARPRTRARSTRAPGDSRARPGRRSTRARCRAGS